MLDHHKKADAARFTTPYTERMIGTKEIEIVRGQHGASR